MELTAKSRTAKRSGAVEYPIFNRGTRLRGGGGMGEGGKAERGRAGKEMRKESTGRNESWQHLRKQGRGLTPNLTVHTYTQSGHHSNEAFAGFVACTRGT